MTIGEIADGVSIVWAVGGLLVAIVGAAGLFWLSKVFASRKAVDDLAAAVKSYVEEHEKLHKRIEHQLGDVERRFTIMETTLRQLPTKAEVADLNVRMEGLRGDIRVATAILQRVEYPVREMVENALAEKG
jgi:phage shock protein A